MKKKNILLDILYILLFGGINGILARTLSNTNFLNKNNIKNKMNFRRYYVL